jgi:excisionase family DNA binding protein
VARAFMTPSDAAATTGLSVKTIYRAIWAGELVASKRGRWLISSEDLAEWILEGRQTERPGANIAPSSLFGDSERGTLAALRAIEHEGLA